MEPTPELRETKTTRLCHNARPSRKASAETFSFSGFNRNLVGVLIG